MPSIYRVRTAINNLAGGSELSTMFFDATTGTPQDAANAVHAFWTDLVNVILNTATMVVDPTVYTLDVATGQPTSTHGTTVANVIGNKSSEVLPTATQGLLRWHTGVFLGGRELQGRTFIPAPTEADSLNGVPSSTYTGILNTAGINLTSAGPITFGVYSREHRQFRQATSASPWGQWALLRSRRL